MFWCGAEALSQRLVGHGEVDLSWASLEAEVINDDRRCVKVHSVRINDGSIVEGFDLREHLAPL